MVLELLGLLLVVLLLVELELLRLLLMGVAGGSVAAAPARLAVAQFCVWPRPEAPCAYTVGLYSIVDSY